MPEIKLTLRGIDETAPVKDALTDIESRAAAINGASAGEISGPVIDMGQSASAAATEAEKSGEEARAAFAEGVKISYGGDEESLAMSRAMWGDSPILAEKAGEEAGNAYAAALVSATPKAAEAGAEVGAAFSEAENEAQAKFNAARETLNFLPTTASIEAGKAEIMAAYEAIKNSGLATDDEIVRAHRAAMAQIEEIDNASFANGTNILQNFRRNWLQISTAVFAAGMAIHEAWHLAEEGAQAEGIEEAFNHVAASYDENAGQIVGALEKVSAGTIAASVLMKNASQEFEHGLNPQQIIDLMQIARSQARLTGETVEKAYEGITSAINSQMTRSLKHYGIVLDLSKVYKQYAGSIGVAVADLTEEQKTQAMANAAIAEGTRQLKAQGAAALDTKTDFEKMQSAQAKLTEGEQDLGKGLLTATNWVADYGKSWAWLVDKFTGSADKAHHALYDLFHPEIAKKEAEVAAEIAAQTDKEAHMVQNAANAHTQEASAINTVIQSKEELAKVNDILGAIGSKDTGAGLPTDLKPLAGMEQQFQATIEKLKSLHATDAQLNEADVEMASEFSEKVAAIKEKWAQEAAKREVEAEKSSIETQIQDLEKWKSQAEESYRAAEDAAREYYDQAKQWSQLETQGNKFLQKLNAPKLDAEDLKDQLENTINDALDSADFSKVKEAMSEAQGYLSSHKGDEDIADEYQQLIDLAGQMKDQAKEAGDQQTEWADTLKASMQTAGTEIDGLKTKIEDLQSSLKLTATLDTSKAEAALQQLQEQINQLLPNAAIDLDGMLAQMVTRNTSQLATALQNSGS